MTVPFLDIKALHEQIRPEIDAAISSVLDSGLFILGPEVAAFESEFAEWVGGGECIGTNSGTSALHLALLACGVGPGDEVVTVSTTFVATTAAIVYTGATPVFVDVDPHTWTMDADACAAAITPRTRAILPVHLHGRMADILALRAIADIAGVALIEDAAQAHGAHRDGLHVGQLSDAACFSFYPGKNLGAIGEAGCVLTRNPEIADRVRVLRDWGARRKYEHEVHAFNYRMEAIQGAVLRIKLRELDRWTQQRQDVAAQYDSKLSSLQLQLPTRVADDGHVYHVYSVLAEDRDAVIEALGRRGIGTGIHYPIPVHELPPYRGFAPPGGLEISTLLAQRFLSIPMSPTLSTHDIDCVVEALKFATRL